jgi:hypothetical protein
MRSSPENGGENAYWCKQFLGQFNKRAAKSNPQPGMVAAREKYDIIISALLPISIYYFPAVKCILSERNTIV